MKRWLVLVEDGPLAPMPAVSFRLVIVACVLTATVAAVIDTVPWIHTSYGRLLSHLEAALTAVFLCDMALRLVAAWGREGWLAVRSYLLGPYGLFDLLAVLPFVAEPFLPQDAVTVFGLARFLKLARYSPALQTLGAVVRREAKPLQSAAFIVALLTLISAAMLYFIERGQPSGQFDTIPDAMWWAIVTLATLGYGDVVPATPLGKIVGAVVALLGLGMFALPASILATGFAEEVRHQHFLLTWRLVARVPFFAELDAHQIAEIASKLRLLRTTPGEVLMRNGEVGHCMYFIARGTVEVTLPHDLVLLKDGDFFGEIALLTDSRRTATVRARTTCHLLTLDVRDFRRVMDANPELKVKVEETARKRLNHCSGEMAEA
jgi:voltage-gated potassium channel